jgi:hypothetical protein
MSMLFSTIVLGLAWFAATNALASLAAWTLAATAGRGIPADGRRAQRLLAIRLLPAAAATVVTLALFLPAHIRLEPRNTDEAFGVVPYALACLALALIARSAWRLAVVLRAGRRLRALTAGTAPIARGRGLEAIEVAGLPGISLAGILRPRVLVGRDARAALTAAELDVALAHETAHQLARDNVKRLAMFCAPDLFASTAAAARIEAEWRAEAECLADASAVGGDRGRAATLASALVKVARLGPVRAPAAQCPAWSTFHEPALLETRVRRLLVCSTPAVRTSRRHAPVLVAAAVAAAWMLDVPAVLHRSTELLVRLLP